MPAPGRASDSGEEPTIDTAEEVAADADDPESDVVIGPEVTGVLDMEPPAKLIPIEVPNLEALPEDGAVSEPDDLDELVVTAPAPRPVPRREQQRYGVSARLPEFPWDRLEPYAETARAHEDGIVDLSVGTPVDDTPEVAQRALSEAANSPGYPQTIGLLETRKACIEWLWRCFGVSGLQYDSVLPVIGTKELIASMPLHLGMGPGDLVVQPELAYPTYEVGAVLAGASITATDSLTALGPQRPALLWLNSPSNPTGRVLPVDHLRKVVEWCRERGTLLVSDECYLEYVWEGQATSVLHPSVTGGSHKGVLAVHSLSKRSNLAGYRCGFVAGDAAVVGELLAVRRNLGLQMPGPQQAAMPAILADDDHVAAQRDRYAARRTSLRKALECAGFRIDHSEGSLYLWVTRDSGDSDCWSLVSWFAERGILVAPGSFYGPTGNRHVRLAFTASDDRVDAACSRLS